MSSHTRQDAVLRNLQTIAEATRSLSEDLKAGQPQIDWARVSAFRNVLVHDYLGIDLEIVWGIVQKDVPELRKAITAMTKEVE